MIIGHAMPSIINIGVCFGLYCSVILGQ